MAIYYVPSINLRGAGGVNELGATVKEVGFKKAVVVTEIGKQTSELQAHTEIAYAVLCMKKKEREE